MTILLILTCDRLQLATRPTDISGSLAVFDSQFAEVSVARSGFLGFYDWLRTPKKEVVGIQLSFDESAANALAVMQKRDYIVYESADTLRVMFRMTDDIDWSTSCDQDFGSTRCFIDANDRVVLAVDAQAIPPNELHRLVQRPS